MKDHFIKRAKPEAKPTKPEKIMIGLRAFCTGKPGYY